MEIHRAGVVAHERRPCLEIRRQPGTLLRWSPWRTVALWKVFSGLDESKRLICERPESVLEQHTFHNYGLFIRTKNNAKAYHPGKVRFREPSRKRRKSPRKEGKGASLISTVSEGKERDFLRCGGQARTVSPVGGTAVRGSQLTYCVEVAAELLADVEEQTVRSVHQAQRPGRESPIGEAR